MRDTSWTFPAATLVPAFLLLLAALFGGFFVWAALLSITLVAFTLDLIVTRAGGVPDAEFPAADLLSTVIAASHFLLLIAGIAGLAGTWLGGLDKLGLALALGLWLGQVSNANAHELIHRADRLLFGLGRWVYISLLFGHHTSAHPKIHHRYVGTSQDPNTAHLGETLYAFVLRAWAGSFVAGWEVERSLLEQRYGRKAALWRHPYAVYLGGAAGLVLAVALIGGWRAVLAYLLLAAIAQAQLLVSDYVQHYGLERRDTAPGRAEPVAPHHSWNAAHPWSSRMMLHAPRHSDHHAHPSRPYPELTLPAADAAPRLPSSLPVMAMAAFVPPLWRRLMDGRARAWARPAPPVDRAA